MTGTDLSPPGLSPVPSLWLASSTEPPGRHLCQLPAVRKAGSVGDFRFACVPRPVLPKALRDPCLGAVPGHVLPCPIPCLVIWVSNLPVCCLDAVPGKAPRHPARQDPRQTCHQHLRGVNTALGGQGQPCSSTGTPGSSVAGREGPQGPERHWQMSGGTADPHPPCRKDQERGPHSDCPMGR